MKVLSSCHLLILFIINLISTAFTPQLGWANIPDEPSPNKAALKPLSLEELTNLANKVSKANTLIQPSCHSSEAPKKQQFFIFDGSMGYCPKLAQLKTTFDQEGVNYYDRFEQQIKSLNASLRIDTDVTVVSLLQKIKAQLESEKALGLNCNYLNALHDVFARLQTSDRKLNLEDSEFRYYGKSGQNEAIHCAEIMIQNTEKNLVHSLDFKLTSFSMGGDAVVSFVNALPDLRVSEVLTVDPVAKGLGALTGVLTTENNQIFTVPTNVLRWSNYYQRLDYKVLKPLPLGIRGSQVKGADLNFELQKVDFKSEKEINRAHAYISTSQVVQTALEQFLRP